MQYPGSELRILHRITTPSPTPTTALLPPNPPLHHAPSPLHPNPRHPSNPPPPTPPPPRARRRRRQLPPATRPRMYTLFPPHQHSTTPRTISSYTRHLSCRRVLLAARNYFQKTIGIWPQPLITTHHPLLTTPHHSPPPGSIPD